MVLASALLIMTVSDGPRAEEGLTSSMFSTRAYELLPVEHAFDYHRKLAEGPVHRLRREPDARPTAEEMALPPEGWTLLIPADSGPVLQHAARDFQDYLQTSMQTRVGLERKTSLTDWAELRQVIVAGTRDQLPTMGDRLKGAKDYEIHLSPERIVVCGFDERGVMYGLYNLVARMNLREAPFLPREMDTVRHSLYQTRMTMSWLGWMEWPDAYLSHLAHDGFDAIYASVYANPNGVEGPPHYDRIRKQDPAQLRDLIQRASRYGIKVYTPILYNYTGEPENEAGLRELVRDIVTTFPEIHGYILLTEGFYFEDFFGAGGHGQTDLRDWAKHWTRAVAIVAEECHKINPAIEVLPWEYNVDFRPQQAELKRHVVSLLPRETIPLVTWENGKSTADREQQAALLDRMIRILEDERQRTQAALETARRDSRLGYECENDYVYSPYTLNEKLELLDETMTDQIPAYRKQHGIP